MTARAVEWVTTTPLVYVLGTDTGAAWEIRGWRVHAIPRSAKDKRAKAACGLRPAHGWSFDLFITERCKRCVRALTRKNQNVGS